MYNIFLLTTTTTTKEDNYQYCHTKYDIENVIEYYMMDIHVKNNQQDELCQAQGKLLLIWLRLDPCLF